MILNLGKILAGVSLAVILTASPIMAQDAASGASATTTTTAAASNSTHGNFEDKKAVIVGAGQKDDAFNYMTYNMSYTAKGIISQKLRNAHGTAFAEIRDIILDKSGRAQMIIVSDGAAFGLSGKMTALDYNKVVKSGENSETLIPIEPEKFTGLVEFVYIPPSAPRPGQVFNLIPPDDVSLRDLMKANLVDEHNRKVAAIGNIVMNKGKAKKLIISFDRIIGVGEDDVSLDFDDTKMNRDQNNMISFEFSPEQAVSFANYKKYLAK